MGVKGKVILKFTENKVGLSIINGSGRNIKILGDKEFPVVENQSSDIFSYGEPVQGSFKKFVSEWKLAGKKAKVVISQDGIITRLIQSPKLNKKDLDSFIVNNIGEYFTLNLEEYEFDYTVMGEEKGEVNKFNILLVLVPKTKLKAVIDFIKEAGLVIEKVTIYPVCIENLFFSERNNSTAVFDVEAERINITILEKGNIFLYSRIPSELEDFNGDYDEVLDSLLYFLNFYAARHFGSRVDRIYVTGAMWNDKHFQEALRESTPSEIVGGIPLTAAKAENDEGTPLNMFSASIGAMTEIKRKYNKDINFARTQKLEREKNENLPVMAALAVVLAVTLIWPAAFTVYKKVELNKYDTTVLSQEKARYISDNQEYDKLKGEEDNYDKKLQLAKGIKSMDNGLKQYVDALRAALPGDTLIKSMYVDQSSVIIDFVITGTLNRVQLAEAINNMGIFQKIDINSIRLDDSEKEASFELKIVKPLKGE